MAGLFRHNNKKPVCAERESVRASRERVGMPVAVQRKRCCPAFHGVSTPTGGPGWRRSLVRGGRSAQILPMSAGGSGSDGGSGGGEPPVETGDTHGAPPPVSAGRAAPANDMSNVGESGREAVQRRSHSTFKQAARKVQSGIKVQVCDDEARSGQSRQRCQRM